MVNGLSIPSLERHPGDLLVHRGDIRTPPRLEAIVLIIVRKVLARPVATTLLVRIETTSLFSSSSFPVHANVLIYL